MRRIIHNTTAIAACLSLLVPQLAQAQVLTIEDSVPGEMPEAAPLVLAQAEEQVPPPPAADQPETEAEAAVPAQEAPEDAAPEAAVPEAAAPEAAAPEAAAPEAAAPEAAAPEAAAPEAAVPEPAPADAPTTAEEPAPAEPVAEAPAAEDAAPVPEDPAAAAPAAEPAPEPVAEPEPQSAAEPEPVPVEEPAAGDEPAADENAAASEAPVEAERPEAAAREQQGDRPETRSDQTDEPDGKADRAAERSERQAEEEQSVETGQSERPVEAAREQEAERPAPRASDDAPAAADPLREPTEGEQATDTPAAPVDPQAEAEANPGDPAASENALRDALAAEQQQDAEAASEPQDRAAETAPVPAEADAPVTEAAQQAAQETRAAPAAALDDTIEGEVVEQQITEENSRSSDEDFATSLRDALEPQAESAAPRAENDDDDNNDLAKALLLGLGAVAVGAYLNNNRQVALSAPDRVVVTRADGSQEVIKDEVALLRQPGSTVATENFDDGSSRTVVTRADGSRVVTIRDADLRVLRRTLVSADGTQTRLIDDTAEVEPVDISTLPAPAPVSPRGTYQDEAALREALQRQGNIDRHFTLGQVRSIPEVRALVPPVNIDEITFDTGSAAITPDQARQLSTLGNVIQQAVADNPREMFLIEGHTDTVGADAANLALSDRRAESVALALSEYFDVPPENLIVQGYGEKFLQVRQEGDVRENRRAAVRQITDLLQTAEVQ